MFNGHQISDYASIQTRGLREARKTKPLPQNSDYLDTFSLTYCLQYDTVSEDGRVMTGTWHKWNSRIDGEPTKHNLHKWIAKHEMTAYKAGYEVMIVFCSLMTTADKKEICKYAY